MPPTSRAVTTDQTHHFDLSVDDVWAAITSTHRYRTWWPWLRSFDGTDFASGSTWACAVRSPLGYTVRFHVELVRVEPPGGEAHGTVTATVRGDIAGRAVVVVQPGCSGAVLRISSDLAPVRPLLRRLGRVAPALARWGHDHVMRSGVRRFRASTTPDTPDRPSHGSRWRR